MIEAIDNKILRNNFKLKTCLLFISFCSVDFVNTDTSQSLIKHPFLLPVQVFILLLFTYYFQWFYDSNILSCNVKLKL